MERIKPAALDVVETWIFDLDNTLYAETASVGEQIGQRMTQFIMKEYDLNQDDAFALRRHMFVTYGTTLRGLMTTHGVDPHRYMDFVHDIDLTGLAPDPRLGEALAALPGRKLIHTNASARHAERILAALNLSTHFEVLFDITAADFRPKPDDAAYRTLQRRHGVDPTRAAMVEDIARNLKPAAEHGMVTVWIETARDWAREQGDAPWIDHRTADLAGWLEALRKKPS